VTCRQDPNSPRHESLLTRRETIKKSLLASTCAVAFVAAASLTFSSASFAQNASSGAQSPDGQSRPEKMSPGSEKMHSEPQKPRQSSEQGAQERPKEQSAQERMKDQSGRPRGGRRFTGQSVERRSRGLKDET
jgi:hypothetical protein